MAPELCEKYGVKKEIIMSNSSLPRSFYGGVIEQLDPRLREFYDEHRDGNRNFAASYFDICAGILSDALNGKTDSSSLNKYWSVQRKQMIRKKKRWLDSLLLNCEQIPKTSDQYPFRNIMIRKQVITKREWQVLYGKKSVDDIIEEEKERASKWAADQDSWFIDFPALDSFTPRRIYQAFEADVLTNQFSVLRDRYPNLDLSSVMISFVDEMAGSYFADNGKKYHKNEDGEETTVNVIPAEAGGSELLITVSQDAFGSNEVITLLDDKDQRILFDIIKRATENVTDGPILVEVGELARIIAGNNHPSKYYYEEAEKRVFRIANFTYNSYKDGVQVGAVNFLSAAFVLENDGKRFLSISTGSTVNEAIVNNKIRRLPSDQYDNLRSKTGRIMILTLQRERLKAWNRFKSGESQDCSATFHYNQLLMMVNFGGNNKKRNLQTVREALAEMKEKHIVVEDYVIDSITNTLRLYFLPLSRDEQKDMEIYNYGDVLEG